MGGKDEVGLSADRQTSSHVHPEVHKGVDFLLENDWVNHHAVAHHIQGVWAEDATGDGVARA